MPWRSVLLLTTLQFDMTHVWMTSQTRPQIILSNSNQLDQKGALSFALNVDTFEKENAQSAIKQIPEIKLALKQFPETTQKGAIDS